MELVWFKKDLRTQDNAALSGALNTGKTACLYIIEPEVVQHPTSSPGQVGFALEALGRLRTELEAMGGRLLIMTGEAVEVLDRLHSELRFERIWSHQETGVWATYERDKRVIAWTEKTGVEWREFRQHGVFRRLGSRDGWARRWEIDMGQPVIPRPDVPSEGWLESQAPPTLIPTLADLGLSNQFQTGRQDAVGETGKALLESFLQERGMQYQKAMSSPLEGWDACSRISPYLTYGTLSLKEVLLELRNRRTELKASPRSSSNTQWRKSLSSFGKRLRWHCHFIQKLETEPELEWLAMHGSLRNLRSDPQDIRFEAWRHGRTGYPMVDACMRALRETGWLNFRMRAMVVSFATYHCWIPWQRVATELATLFVDFEPGIHYCQVQMQSGVTGMNTLRIYNPTKQLKDHDPEGLFVRKWVPELRDAPLHQILSDKPHEGDLWTPKNNYPPPIVEHASATKKAREIIYGIRKTPEARMESKRVYEKHGSRRRPQQRRPQVTQKKSA